MTYVTYVWRSDPATTNGEYIWNTMSGAGTLISGGYCVGVPSSSGAVCISPSQTAVITWNGPSSINSTNSTINAVNYRVDARNVSEGECLWMTATYLQ